MNSSLHFFLHSNIAAFLLIGAGCDNQYEPATGSVGLVSAPTAQAAAASAPAADAQISPNRIQLLELAFDAASAIPAAPHVKDRSRAQAAVVEACLTLDQPTLAAGFIPKIEDWRRGTALADYAFHLAKRGDTGRVEHDLALAEQIAAKAEDWRRDRIRAKIARVRILLSQPEQAARFESGLVESEMGKGDEVRAMIGDEAEFERQMAALDSVVAQRSFDLTRSALEAAAQWFNRFYDDSSRRDLIERKIMSCWGSCPEMFRLDLLSKLAGYALSHHDQAKALELVNQGQNLLSQHGWSPEYELATAARLTALRHRAGDIERAASDIQSIEARYERERDKIMGIDRAGVLRAIAEAHAHMQDAAASLRVYSRAVNEGADNPNARPRALDLSATCSSMALAGVEPDDELWTRLRHIRAGLSQPW